MNPRQVFLCTSIHHTYHTVSYLMIATLEFRALLCTCMPCVRRAESQKGLPPAVSRRGGIKSPPQGPGPISEAEPEGLRFFVSRRFPCICLVQQTPLAFEYEYFQKVCPKNRLPGTIDATTPNGCKNNRRIQRVLTVVLSANEMS